MSTPAPPPTFSIVVPCRSQSIELERCLQALTRLERKPSFEIVLVDAAWSQEVQMVGAHFPGVRTVRSKVPLGAGAARNLGSRHARGRFLAFTDADCEPEPGWLEAAAAGLHLGGHLVGGPVLHAQALHPIRAADNMLQFADVPPGRPDGPADHFPACNIAISREDFEAIGGFPEVPSGPCEDVVFAERAGARWDGGLRFVRSMRVRHLGRGGLGEFWRHQERFGYCRAALNLKLREVHRKMGRSFLAIGPVVLKRTSYLLGRAFRWNRLALLYWMVLLPFLLFGLLAWALGFRRGCRQGPAPEEAK